MSEPTSTNTKNTTDPEAPAIKSPASEAVPTDAAQTSTARTGFAGEAKGGSAASTTGVDPGKAVWTASWRPGADGPRRLPPWLTRPIGGGAAFARTARAVKGLNLTTVCEEARCPNRGECWSAGTATFMILGDECTRRCGFCSVKDGTPRGRLDAGEPERLAQAIATMGLNYAVITSVDRDDLPDRGAAHFVNCIRAIRRRSPGIAIELLTPDFRGEQDSALQTIGPLAAEAPLVWGHNVETIPRLYRSVRPGSTYKDSLALLRRAGGLPGVTTKSSIMLGLGETRAEVLAVLDDLVAARVTRMTIGQYLRPSPRQMDVYEFVHPEVFKDLAREAQARGIKWIISAPFARSSYHAELPEATPESRWTARCEEAPA